MKKFIAFGTLLALLVAALSIPAVAQVDQEFGQESESGDVSVEGSVTSSGDYAIQCVAPLQFGNTGNLQNAQGFIQYDSTVDDDVEFEGSEFVFEPSVETVCGQAVQQSAAASS